MRGRHAQPKADIRRLRSRMADYDDGFYGDYRLGAGASWFPVGDPKLFGPSGDPNRVAYSVIEEGAALCTGTNAHTGCSACMSVGPIRLTGEPTFGVRVRILPWEEPEAPKTYWSGTFEDPIDALDAMQAHHWTCVGLDHMRLPPKGGHRR